MDRPCAVIVDDASLSLLKALLNSTSPSGKKLAEDKVTAHELTLDTKYYSSQVHLCVLAERTVVSADFAETVEAVVVNFDGHSLDVVVQWLPFIKEWEPEVKVLVCDRLSTALVDPVGTWCLENEFELVELDPSAETKAELEDYHEVYGVARVLQMLKSHMWSNAEMKSDPTANTNRLRHFLAGPSVPEPAADEEQLNENAGSVSLAGDDDDVRLIASKLASGAAVSNGSSSSAASTKDAKASHTAGMDELLTEDTALFEAMAAGEDGDMSFEQMFAKFEHMKQTAESLPADQRKAFAEKVTKAFWKAIGGDENELSDLSSDGENAT